MNKRIFELIQQLKAQGLPPEQEQLIAREIKQGGKHLVPTHKPATRPAPQGLYDWNDLKALMGYTPHYPTLALLKSLDELLEQDKQREQDGFPRRIRLGKLVKPAPNGKNGEVIIVPTTTETKFYHDDEPSNQDQPTGGTGEGEVGEVIGEQKAKQQQGEGQGAGQGEGGDHDMTAQAFDLGRILTEKFDLPNLKPKGNKKSLTQIQYDLTDRNEGFGQILDKKATLRKVLQTNILLGKVRPDEEVRQDELITAPTDRVYQILSPEKDVEAQAMVFFVRDYSGSMEGKPTEVISSLHLFIYSWLVYQFNHRVETRFILHDTEAKEVPDFYTYYRSSVAGGTNIYPAYELVNKIVAGEQLARDYNIYVFHGTDGDDWDYTGEKMLAATREMLTYTSRLGITVAKNNWSNTGATTVEKYLENSGILREKPDLIRMDSLFADKAGEGRIIEGIKKLVA